MENFKTRLSKWLDTESKTGNFLMSDDGPVTRREVLLMQAIVLFVLAGASAIDDSIWISAMFLIASAWAVRRLHRIDKNKQLCQQKNSTKSTNDSAR